MKWSRFGALALAASLVDAASGPASQAASDRQQARVLAHSVLPAASFRGGSPPSGAFLTPAERAVAAANGVDGPGAGPFFSAQPIQGFSSLVPGADGALVGARRQRLRLARQLGRRLRALPARSARSQRQARSSSRPSSCATPTAESPGRSSAIPGAGCPCPASPSTPCRRHRRPVAATPRRAS